MARWWQVDLEEGAEPDYRFTLANERTFLAWIRTSLGLLAGGVAVRQLIDPFDVPGGRTLLALLAIGGSAVLSMGGYLRWLGVQRAVQARRSAAAGPSRSRSSRSVCSSSPS